MKELSVLIIEDDTIYGNMLKDKLEQKVEKVALSESAEKASGIVSSMKPDLIFLDNILPKLQGVEVIELYKELSPESAIILMSGSYIVKDIAIAIQNGADYIIDKSLTQEVEIMKIIETAVASKKKKGRFWRLMDLMSRKDNGNYRKNIAVLEDDELFSFHLSWKLEQTDNNHLIYTFGTAEEFYQYCEVSRPDVVFLDYSLPDTNGYEVLKYVKNRFPNVKVVVVSSLEDPNKVLQLKELGIENYIVKNEEWKSNLNKVMEKMEL